MKLTLRQLDIFRAIAQLGSTTSASAALALSQSATSAALHELEESLSARLFDRVGKRLVLNDNGRALFPQAVRVLEAVAQMEDGLHTDTLARLRVGCSTTIGNYIMPLIMELLDNSALNLRIDVVMGNSADIAKQAAQLTIDIGLIEGPCHVPDLVTEPWFEDELVIVAAAADPLSSKAVVTLEDLRQAPWLIRENGSGTAEEVFQLLMPYLGHWRDTRQVGSSEAIKRMVAAGIGISCLSRWVVGDLVAQGLLAILKHEIPTHKRQLYRVRHRDKFTSRALAGFQRLLEVFAANR